METELQKDRFKGEYQVLRKYSDFNSISEKLYSGDSDELDRSISFEYRSIAHLREDISCHISGILKKVKPSQVYGVIKQHSLASDCARLLGDTTLEHHKNHGSTLPACKKVIKSSA